MITTTKYPYEFLVRWRDGKITGAHVGFELTTLEDGVVLSVTPLSVMSVDVGTGKGFPLADILSQLHIDAIAAMDSANTKCAEQEKLATELSTAAAEKDARIEALSTQVAQLDTYIVELSTRIEGAKNAG